MPIKIGKPMMKNMPEPIAADQPQVLHGHGEHGAHQSRKLLPVSVRNTVSKIRPGDFQRLKRDAGRRQTAHFFQRPVRFEPQRQPVERRRKHGLVARRFGQLGFHDRAPAVAVQAAPQPYPGRVSGHDP